MDPLVSFVVPCYKLAHFLSQCVNSILSQTFRDFEVIVMDNCSPDNTPEVARSFGDSRVKHIRNQVNLGHVRNFNKGIQTARGKYVWLISADDFLRSPHVLGRYVELMERNPQVGYTFCRATGVQEGRDSGNALWWTDYGKEDRIWKGPDFLRRLIRSNGVVMSSVMARKQCYEKITDFPSEMPHAGDWYMWSAFALHHDVGYFSEPMVCWRTHEESLTSQFQSEDASICVIDELNVLWAIAREAKRAGVSTCASACNRAIAGRAARALSSGSAGAAAACLSFADFEKVLGQNVSTPKDAADVRARVSLALGDRQHSGGEYRKARESYWLSLQIRPFWAKSWVKYLLLRMGRSGIGLRRYFLRPPASQPQPKTS